MKFGTQYGYRLQRLFAKKPRTKPTSDPKKTDEVSAETEEQDMFIERIRLENMELRFDQCLYFHSLYSWLIRH